ncbi:helix-turn-helix domain-containing protein [Cecembia lonarensis]|uniref:Putative transcriptional regulator n=1 Tax=Cecembia lonarensis (strain CCUG 58316 / KCTC 22772 / LW9) TaxID=1225176 RepID=K1KYI9_CECL9|nr:helix-turn-helix domain-containing protein [Cecembia lonarensis]EKB47571.1 putative transcriptional regulator [Cecembia lonarensis LW9]
MKEENIRIIFGLKLKQLRKDKNLSLQDLSEKTGISISYLNEIEKSKKYPKADKVFKLAAALEVEYDYLVSLQLEDKMKPIADLLHSDILSELPLNLFGIDAGTLIELLSDTPTKLNAFIITLMDISRAYGISLEEFFLSALRAYQEMHDNYFPELEKQVNLFKKAHQVDTSPKLEELKAILEQQFGYEISYFDFEKEVGLPKTRTLTLPGKTPKLLLNPNLTENQALFALGRELGYAYLDLKNRPYSSSWIAVNSFEEVLQHFKASYFSCALIIPEKEITKDLEDFFSQPELDPELLLQLIEKYNVTPETLVYRITNILPKHFGLKELFFLRISKNIPSGQFSLDKELYLTGIHHPHASKNQEDYCRRWVSATIFNDFSKSNTSRIGKAQYSFYPDGQSYFVFALAYQSGLKKQEQISISFGLKVNALFKKKVKFHNDPKIPLKYVGNTCQYCPIENCEERVAPATKLRAMQAKLEKEEKLNKVKKLFS